MGTMLSATAWAVLVLLVLAAHHIIAARCNRRRRLRYLPGPPPHFLLGHFYDLPIGPESWKAMEKMGQTYGPVIRLGVLNRNIIVINSYKAASDLLEKRSAIYSDRPVYPMLGELMGYDWIPAMHRYGDYWRLHRRAIHQHFCESAVKEQWPELARVNGVFLGLLLGSPDKFWDHTRWLAGANVMSVTYGIDVLLEDDPYIQLGMESLQIGSTAGAQGAYLVDALHALKYLPAWLPGMGFKRQARKWKVAQLRARDEPVDFVKQEMASGVARSSMTSQLLSDGLDGRSVPEDVIRNSTGVVYFAGADTSVGIMQAFFLAMVLYPDSQRTAKAEIDAYLSSQGGRMPQLDDRPRLPYVTALLREIMRSFPPLPLGLAHSLMQDDEYEGMLIPKNAFVLANVWAMLHDSEYYPNPETFDPSRFIRADGRLDPNVLDPAEIAFGFGRRVCPGRHFAEAEIWLMIATTLYCFDIAPAKDEHGADIRPSDYMNSGLVSAISKFECTITPRSPAKRALVEAGM